MVCNRKQYRLQHSQYYKPDDGTWIRNTVTFKVICLENQLFKAAPAAALNHFIQLTS